MTEFNSPVACDALWSAVRHKRRLTDIHTLADNVALEVIVNRLLAGADLELPRQMILLAHVVTRDPTVARKTAAEMKLTFSELCAFVQAMRVLRGSLGSAAKKVVRHWFSQQKDEELFRCYTSRRAIARLIKLAHPKPKTERRAALYRYLLGQHYCKADPLPTLVHEWEEFKANVATEKRVPNIPLARLTRLPLRGGHWKTLAVRASYPELLRGLNMFASRGAFTDSVAVQTLNERIAFEAKKIPKDLLEKALARIVPAAKPVREALRSALVAPLTGATL